MSKVTQYRSREGSYVKLITLICFQLQETKSEMSMIIDNINLHTTIIPTTPLKKHKWAASDYKAYN